MNRRVASAVSVPILAAMLGGCATPLEKAADAGDLAQVQALVPQGRGPNDEGDMQDALFRAADSAHADVVDFLLKHGAKDKIPGHMSAFWRAAWVGSRSCIAVFIANGADPFVTAGGTWNNTPREMAETSTNHPEIVALLKQYENQILAAGVATISQADRARIGLSVIKALAPNQSESTVNGAAAEPASSRPSSAGSTDPAAAPWWQKPGAQ